MRNMNPKSMVKSPDDVWLDYNTKTVIWVKQYDMYERNVNVLILPPDICLVIIGKNMP